MKTKFSYQRLFRFSYLIHVLNRSSPGNKCPPLQFWNRSLQTSNQSALWSCLLLACTQTLFYFSFRSFRKHSWKHHWARENERGERERKIIIFSSTPPLPYCAGGPLRFIFLSRALDEDIFCLCLIPVSTVYFRERTCGARIVLDGLWRENRGFVNRLVFCIWLPN